MTELREALRPNEGEDPIAFEERVNEVLEQHGQRTGEKIGRYGIMPGEGPGDVLARIRKLDEAEKLRGAEEPRLSPGDGQKQSTSSAGKPHPQSQTRTTAADISSRASWRLKSQERAVEVGREAGVGERSVPLLLVGLARSRCLRWIDVYPGEYLHLPLPSTRESYQRVRQSTSAMLSFL